MPIQSDYDVISGAGGDITMGLGKGLMLQRDREEAKRKEQLDNDYKAINIGMQFIEKGMANKDPQVRSEMAKIYNNMLPMLDRVGLKGMTSIDVWGDNETQQQMDVKAIMNGDLSSLQKANVPIEKQVEIYKTLNEINKRQVKVFGGATEGHYQLDEGTGELKQLTEGLGRESKGYAPTELSKLQTEYDTIKNVNPNDPRLKQYEAVIKKMTEGLPYYTFQATDTGITPFNIRTGEAGKPTGERKPITEEVAIQGATFKQLEDTAKNILNQQTKDPSLTGFIQGNWRNIASKVRNDPDFVAFKTQINQLIESAYALSGKQISEKEIKMLEKLRGSFVDPDYNFRASMNEFIKWIEDKQTIREKALSGIGRGVGVNTTNIDIKNKTTEELLKMLEE